jgi:hypothetical protein
MRIYVAGPMTGLPGYNLAAFAAATLELQSLGYDAVNPGRRGADPAKTWVDYMREGLIDVLSCDAVALLGGWEASKGATLEVHVARSLAMPVEPLAEWLKAAP